MRLFHPVTGLISLLLLSLLSEIQATSPSLCACSPALYIFSFDFDQSTTESCNNDNVTTIPDQSNLESVMCTASLLDANTTSVDDDEDVTPVVITRVQLMELDQSLMPLEEFELNGQFENGDQITFLSIINQPDLPDDHLPKGLQAKLTGLNAAQEPVETHWQILFTNECGADAFPVLRVGDQIGFLQITWATLTSRYCPAVLPTPAPTNTPTQSPLIPPTTSSPLTALPTKSPEPGPTTGKPSTTAMTASPTTASPSQSTNTPVAVVTATPTSIPPTTMAPITPEPATQSPTVVVASSAPTTAQPSTTEPTFSTPTTALPTTTSPIQSTAVPTSPPTESDRTPPPVHNIVTDEPTIPPTQSPSQAPVMDPISLAPRRMQNLQTPQPSSRSPSPRPTPRTTPSPIAVMPTTEPPTTRSPSPPPTLYPTVACKRTKKKMDSSKSRSKKSPKQQPKGKGRRRRPKPDSKSRDDKPKPQGERNPPMTKRRKRGKHRRVLRTGRRMMMPPAMTKKQSPARSCHS
uniref:Uncharacterized protein n=1 Tax=Entomoneis paludosa TaxID=265537 RepID=A0A7S3DSR0_9STRA|mmetsp:Transcript_32457/g.67684  ORF Transcript_32457/g.67684 Transcript_32457/m.67684 type:complete len:520 (+) Transcript_32457:138-1697(+)